MGDRNCPDCILDQMDPADSFMKTSAMCTAAGLDLANFKAMIRPRMISSVSIMMSLTSEESAFREVDGETYIHPLLIPAFVQWAAPSKQTAAMIALRKTRPELWGIARLLVR